MTGPTEPPDGRSPGRPRDPAVAEAVLAATLSLLAEHGYAGLTMDALASEAGVSKASIYRRWSSKDDVVLAAVEQLSQVVPTPDTGTLRGDLTAIAEGLAAVFSAPRSSRLIGTLIARMGRDAQLATALRGGFLAARRGAARTALERARDRGEARPDADLEFAVDLLAAPFYYRTLVTGTTVDEELAADVVETVLRTVAPPP